MRARICAGLLLTIALVGAAEAQTYTPSVLYNFGSSSADGVYPFGGLVRDAAGNLYGTTWSGGGSLNCSPYSGCGMGVMLDSSGSGSGLHTFSGGTDEAVAGRFVVEDGAGGCDGRGCARAGLFLDAWWSWERMHS